MERLIGEEHAARAIWEFVGRLDMSGYREEVRAVEGKAGRPGWEPRLLISLWVYAYSEGVGSARAIEELCEWEPGYQWLTGATVVNAHTLSDFRVKHESAAQGIVCAGFGAVKRRWIDHAGTSDAGRDQDSSARRPRIVFGEKSEWSKRSSKPRNK